MNAFEGAMTPDDDDPFSEANCTKDTCQFDKQCINYGACHVSQMVRGWRAEQILRDWGADL